MKLYRYVLLLLWSCNCFAQAGYVIFVDRYSGAFSKFCNPVGINNMPFGEGTYSASKGVFYMLGGYPCNCLIGVNLKNVLMASQAPASSYYGFQYDDLSGKMYALKHNAGSNSMKFGEFNTQTGLFTQIGTDILGASGGSQGFRSYNPFQKLYSFYAGFRWVTLDATTGKIVSDTQMQLPSNYVVSAPCFSELDSLTYFLLNDNNTQTNYIATMDTASGIFNLVGNGGQGIMIGGGSAAIDPVNKKYLHLGTSGQFYYISTFDLLTGQFQNSAYMPFPQYEYGMALQYDKSREWLLALTWSNTMEYVSSAGENMQQQDAMKLIRNVDGYDLIFEEPGNYQASLVDILGRASAVDVSGIKGTISTSSLNPGVYYLVVKAPSGTECRKLLIEAK